VAMALLIGTIVFSFGEVIFSSAVPAAVARLAPPGRRGAYQGGWALVSSISMGSALFFSGLLSGTVGWRPTWLICAGVVVVAAVLLHRARER
jgi:MFS family permease